ncbi:MAG: hypothetical protein D6762_08920 [Candidatus Neomarinimicrobiota bacterium]|nr:MAG: hypothetical protein D6762_08920 [Candidatus Neomarinimicrobiota bacterium]
MKPTTKAILCSLFLFPGLGQVLSGRKKSGWIFIGAELLAVISFLTSAVRTAWQIVNQLSGHLDLPDLFAAAHEAVLETGSTLTAEAFVILLIWFASGLHVIWVSRAAEAKTDPGAPHPEESRQRK